MHICNTFGWKRRYLPDLRKRNQHGGIYRQISIKTHNQIRRSSWLPWACYRRWMGNLTIWHAKTFFLEPSWFLNIKFKVLRWRSWNVLQINTTNRRPKQKIVVKLQHGLRMLCLNRKEVHRFKGLFNWLERTAGNLWSRFQETWRTIRSNHQWR